MNFKNLAKSIQTTGYNGMRTVYRKSNPNSQIPTFDKLTFVSINPKKGFSLNIKIFFILEVKVLPYNCAKLYNGQGYCRPSKISQKIIIFT